MSNDGPDLNRLLGTGPTADDLIGDRRVRRSKQPKDYTQPEESELRLRILDRLSRMHQEAFDQWTEQAAKALISVMDYHRPWNREQHIFEGGYHVGETQSVAGCRSCSWSYRSDCPTVMAVGHALGLTQL